MIDRRSLLKSLAGLGAALILPPSLADNAEAARRYWALDRTMLRSDYMETGWFDFNCRDFTKWIQIGPHDPNTMYAKAADIIIDGHRLELFPLADREMAVAIDTTRAFHGISMDQAYEWQPESGQFRAVLARLA